MAAHRRHAFPEIDFLPKFDFLSKICFLPEIHLLQHKWTYSKKFSLPEMTLAFIFDAKTSDFPYLEQVFHCSASSRTFRHPSQALDKDCHTAYFVCCMSGTISASF